MLVLIYREYDYYDPTIELEEADGKDLETYEKNIFKGNDEYCDDTGDGCTHYFKITNRHQLINALKYILQNDTRMEEDHSVQTEDLIKLLRDGNLGDTFFDRFVTNIQWLDNRPTLKAKVLDIDETYSDYSYYNDLLILDNPVYWAKEPIELQKFILSYLLDNNIKFDNQWFDIEEKDIQQWRHETEIRKLKETLRKKSKDLSLIQNKLKRLQKEIADLTEKIAQTENE